MIAVRKGVAEAKVDDDDVIISGGVVQPDAREAAPATAVHPGVVSAVAAAAAKANVDVENAKVSRLQAVRGRSKGKQQKKGTPKKWPQAPRKWNGCSLCSHLEQSDQLGLRHAPACVETRAGLFCWKELEETGNLQGHAVPQGLRCMMQKFENFRPDCWSEEEHTTIFAQPNFFHCKFAHLLPKNGMSANHRKRNDCRAPFSSRIKDPTTGLKKNTLQFLLSPTSSTTNSHICQKMECLPTTENETSTLQFAHALH